MQKLHEACAVFGFYRNDHDVDTAQLTFLALHAMQHRGQDGTGIAAASENGTAVCYKNPGLVTEVFNAETLKQFRNRKILIGHNRYATTNTSHHSFLNTQPIFMHGRDGAMAMAHNGQLLNSANWTALRRSLQQQGALFQTNTDSELLLHLIANQPTGSLEERVAAMMTQVRGSYAITVLGQNKLIGARDPWGIRPLVLGKLGKSWVLASESCAVDAIGGEVIREVNPGEIIVIDEDGLRSLQTPRMGPGALCVFEYVYFARPDSCMQGQGVYAARQRMGERLALTAPVEADMVAGVPDSAIQAAQGYARASGIPYGDALMKNRYTGRSFIIPGQAAREKLVAMKLSVLKDQVEGKRLVLVDDSIVRGTNCMILVRMLRKAGAKEVHVRISSPPVMYPCYFGIDTPTAANLIGAQYDVEHVREQIGADSLAYLELPELKAAVGLQDCGLCSACFDGNYPVPLKGKK